MLVVISTFPTRRRPHPRAVGALVGFGIAGVLTLAAALSDQVSSGNPILPTLFAPILLAGTLGGAAVGRRAGDPAWTATRGSRFRLRLRLAVMAVLIGAPVVALQIGVDSLLRGYTAGLLDLLAGVLVITPVGIIFVGPFALPITYASALVWSWFMRRVVL